MTTTTEMREDHYTAEIAAVFARRPFSFLPKGSPLQGGWQEGMARMIDDAIAHMSADDEIRGAIALHNQRSDFIVVRVGALIDLLKRFDELEAESSDREAEDYRRAEAGDGF